MTKDLAAVQGPYGFYVHWKGGGVKPKVLEGYYTSLQEANLAIENYKNRPKAKAKPKIKKVEDGIIEDSIGKK